MTRNTKADAVRNLFYERLGTTPFCQMPGPNESVLFWYQIGNRVVIVQAFHEGGWCEHIGSDHRNVEQTFNELKKLQGE